jgi:integrase
MIRGNSTRPVRALRLDSARHIPALSHIKIAFARVSAVVTLWVEDYFQQGRRWWARLHEKGGKWHEVPCHHSMDQYLDAWIAAAGIGGDKKGPLFRSFKKGDKLTDFIEGCGIAAGRAAAR